MLKVNKKGDFNALERFFNNLRRREYLNIIADHANEGIRALEAATPEDSGDTAKSWGYKIQDADGRTTLTFTNSNENNGCNVAILLIYGHATRNGRYVEGVDFVTPALQPVFQDIADKLWEEVRKC